MKGLLFVGILCAMGALASAKTRLVPFGNNTNENEAIEFLRRYNEGYARLVNNASLADWAYNTNITDENAAASNDAWLRVSAYGAEAFQDAEQFDPTGFGYDTRRQLSFVGRKSLSDEEMRNLTEIISTMGNIYGTTQICVDPPTNATCEYLEPGLTNLLASISSPESLKKSAWYGWHDQVGSQMRPLYIQYKQLKNKLAQLNGYTDYGQELRDRYDDVNYDLTAKAIYDEMLPLYKELHAYVRFKLSNYYNLNLTTTIPQHILGDMWGRFWTNTYGIAAPFPDKPSLDVTDNMIRQNYTILRMFNTSNEFYKSMGLLPLPETFFNLSMLDKPEDREVVCHATAWDFYDGKDFRIKMCTKINFEDFLTIHHEMGHIQYFMQYSDQPTVYRDGANDGFHEAVGELMSMCVSTPKHLYAIGLLDELLNDNETTINYLFSQALTTVSTIPFHYLNDRYRWDIFDDSKNIPVTEWNQYFWQLFRDIVGVTPPDGEIRSENFLDSPTIFHVAQDYDMIRYFTRTILQFQFAESLCEVSGHVGPLYECDFYGSLAAGDKLSAMLKLGASKPWPEALEALTGSPDMTATAIRKYFEPLEEWLTAFNSQNNNTVGW